MIFLFFHSLGLDIPKHAEPAYPVEAYGHGWGEKGDALKSITKLAAKNMAKFNFNPAASAQKGRSLHSILDLRPGVQLHLDITGMMM